MDRFERLCKILRDLGIFFLGVAGLIAAIDYFFIHPDPMREAQREIAKSMGKNFSDAMRQVHDEKSEPVGSSNLPKLP